MQAYNIAFISKEKILIPIQARLIPFDPETLYSTKILTIFDEYQGQIKGQLISKANFRCFF